MPKKKKRSGSAITPKVLLDHMRAMEARILQTMNERFLQVDKRFEQVDKRFTQVDKRFDGLEKQIAWLGAARDNLGDRLDDIEEVQIPKLKKAVGMR